MVRDEIVFTVNSPGEVSTWLAPTVAALKRLAPDVKATVFILPCLYASGTELDVVRRMPGVEAVVSPRESLRYIVGGRLPGGWRPAGRGAVVFLGGELLLAALLSKRLGYPAAAYTEGVMNAPAAFSRVFVSRESAREQALRKGVPKDRIRVIGDLMVDAARVAKDEAERREVSAPLTRGDERRIVAILPGSRPYELRHTFPVMLGAAALLARWAPGLRFVVAVSPYTTREALARGLEASARWSCGDEKNPASASEPVLSPPGALERLFASDAGGRTLLDATVTTPEGPVEVTFWRGPSRVVMAGAALALTIPGSNTAELAAWGVPMVVTMPLSSPEEVPLDGVLGYIDKIPLIGRSLKAKAVLRAVERTPFVALPNRIAQELIVPELRSTRLLPREVAEEARRLLDEPEVLKSMGSRLVEVMGAGGGAEALVRETLKLLQP